MTYILRIGPWHVGPFPTHIAAQHFAETHGCDDFTLVPLDDPAEAPGRIHRLRMAELKHPMAQSARIVRERPWPHNESAR
jgi:hypothetical protein